MLRVVVVRGVMAAAVVGVLPAVTVVLAVRVRVGVGVGVSVGVAMLDTPRRVGAQRCNAVLWGGCVGMATAAAARVGVAMVGIVEKH